MSKRSTKTKQQNETPAAPPPLTPAPEHRGTPIRPENFPTIHEVSMLAAQLASSPPKTDAEAKELAGAALRLWRVTRDEIIEQHKRASEYWQSTDTNTQAIRKARARVSARLQLLGCSHLAQQASVSWSEAEGALFPSLKPKERTSALSALVNAHMAGQSCWSKWQLADFKNYGFDSALSFASLVASFDESEATKAKIAESERMRLLGKKSAKKKKERKEWGKLASPTSQRKTP